MNLWLLLCPVHPALNGNYEPADQNSKDEPEEHCSVGSPVEGSVDG